MLSMEASMLRVGVEEVPDPANKRKKKKSNKSVPTGEINWSLGTYTKHADIEKAFGISGLPRTSKIAPNQPFLHKKVYKYWGLLLLATLVLGIFINASGSRTKVFDQTFPLQPVANAEATQVIFTDKFDLKSGRNIKVSMFSGVDNTWLYVEGDLINDDTGDVQTFSMPVEYYHGVEDGESWSEGNQSPSIHLSAMPAGHYLMRLEAQWEKWQQPASLIVHIEQGVPRLLHMFLVMVFISIIPVFVMLYQFSFEKRRWADSDYSPFGSE